MLSSIHQPGTKRGDGTMQGTADSLYRDVYINDSGTSRLRQTVARAHALANSGLDTLKDSLNGQSSRDASHPVPTSRSVQSIHENALRQGVFVSGRLLATVRKQGLVLWRLREKDAPERVAFIPTSRLQEQDSESILQIVCRMDNEKQDSLDYVSILSQSNARGKLLNLSLRHDKVFKPLAQISREPLAIQHSQSLCGILSMASEHTAKLDIYRMGSTQVELTINNVVPSPHSFSLSDSRLVVQLVSPTQHSTNGNLGKHISDGIVRSYRGVGEVAWSYWTHPSLPGHEKKVLSTHLRSKVRTQIMDLILGATCFTVEGTRILLHNACAYLQLSPDAQYLAVSDFANGGRDCLIYRVGTAESNISTALFRLYRGNSPCEVVDLRWSQDSDWVGMSTNHGTVHLWSLDLANMSDRSDVCEEGSSPASVQLLKPVARLKLPGHQAPYITIPFDFVHATPDAREGDKAEMYPPWRRHLINVNLLDLARGALVIYQVEDQNSPSRGPSTCRNTKSRPHSEHWSIAIVGVSVLGSKQETGLETVLEEVIRGYTSSHHQEAADGSRQYVGQTDVQMAWSTIPSIPNRPSLASYLSLPLAVPAKAQRLSHPSSVKAGNVECAGPSVMDPRSSFEYIRNHHVTERFASAMSSAGAAAIVTVRNADAERRLRWYGQGKDQQDLVTTLRAKMGRENGISGLETLETDASANWDIEFSSDEEVESIDLAAQKKDRANEGDVSGQASSMTSRPLPSRASSPKGSVSIEIARPSFETLDDSDLDSSPTRPTFAAMSSPLKSEPLDLTPPSSVPRSQEMPDGFEEFLKAKVQSFEIRIDDEGEADEQCNSSSHTWTLSSCSHQASDDASEGSQSPSALLSLSKPKIATSKAKASRKRKAKVRK